MQSLASIECFVRSAEAGSFAEAARRLGLTPAAVGKNVARLETGLAVRLFQRSTRSLVLTEAGERFLQEVSGGLHSIRNAVANLATAAGQPAGTLRVSMGTSFGRDYVLPMLPDFLARYPAITPDWHFDNRQVDLIAEGYDAAIGGAIELPPGVVARRLGSAARVLVAAPRYLQTHGTPRRPADLAGHDGILIRSPQTGRVRALPLRNKAGEEQAVGLRPRILMSDPEVACRTAEMGLGVAVASLPHALPFLQAGSLLRVLPGWYVDGGNVSIYYAEHKLLPAKTRAFVDFLLERFRQQKLAERFAVD